jgi:hypothetical protein
VNKVVKETDKMIKQTKIIWLILLIILDLYQHVLLLALPYLRWLFFVFQKFKSYKLLTALDQILKRIIQLTLAHIRMTYTTTEKNLLYNKILPIITHNMCIERHKRNNQIQISELIDYIAENSQ